MKGFLSMEYLMSVPNNNKYAEKQFRRSRRAGRLWNALKVQFFAYAVELLG
jgi:hypothetical protein